MCVNMLKALYRIDRSPSTQPVHSVTIHGNYKADVPCQAPIKIDLGEGEKGRGGKEG